MALVMRQLLVLLVVTTIGLAGVPVHEDDSALAGRAPVEHAGEQHQESQDGMRHDHATDVECVQTGHCLSLVLILSPRSDPGEAPFRNTWGVPPDVHASSLKPEASVPPPRSA